MLNHRSGFLVFVLLPLAGCAAPSSAPPRSSAAPAREVPPTTPPKAEPPVGNAEAVKAGPASEPVPTPEPIRAAAPGADPSWWIASPRRGDGRVSIAAKADADSLIDARRAAVQAGSDALLAQAGRQPDEIRTDKTDVSRLSDGRWRAFVLMSCKE